MSRKPPLSYCFASFHPGDYDRYPEPLGRLWTLGFRWVTLVPTFAVRKPFEIGFNYTPPLATIRAVLAHALALGFHVKLEPHLDWQSTLDGKGEWRGFMQFDPSLDYADHVIAPMAELTSETRTLYPENRLMFTLGSEVDRSVREFPEAWLRVRNSGAAGGVELGHKLNHDASAGMFQSEYLRGLDYVSFSFYPHLGIRRSDVEAGALASAFERQAAALQRKLPSGPEFQIGEFGLGGAGLNHSYRLDPEFFENMDEGRRELRRKYYAGFLDCARRLDFAGLVTFWSAGYFDILGVFDSRYKDESIVEMVEEYNR